MQQAFATLPEQLRVRLIELDAEHGLEGFARRYSRAKGQPFVSEGARTAGSSPPPNVSHPAVVRHPETGAPVLFVNPGFTIRFSGMSEGESEELVDQLATHATKPENVYRHRWQAGDVVLWDNFRRFCQTNCTGD